MSSPALPPTRSFDEASRAVLEFLQEHIPMGFWAVTRYDGEAQLYLEVRDSAYGLGPGGSHRWADSFCQHMVTGATPQITGDAMAVPQYAAAGVSQQVPIGSYVGMPISWSQGKLFGTLCGLDPATKGDALDGHEPLLHLLTSLLGSVLEADLARVEADRALERALVEGETDHLTGLLNRRGWDRLLQLEEARNKRFGDPVSVIIIDLDRLKLVNDRHGHAAGDEYIRRAGDAIRGAVRSSDIVARLGGDEFGIVAPRTGPTEAQEVVRRITRSFDAARVSGSIGAAPYTIVAGFPGACRDADSAMYAEKQRRRDVEPDLDWLGDEVLPAS